MLQKSSCLNKKPVCLNLVVFVPSWPQEKTTFKQQAFLLSLNTTNGITVPIRKHNHAWHQLTATPWTQEHGNKSRKASDHAASDTSLKYNCVQKVSHTEECNTHPCISAQLTKVGRASLDTECCRKQSSMPPEAQLFFLHTNYKSYRGQHCLFRQSQWP